MARKILTTFVVVLLIIACNITASAVDFDKSKNGTISVTLTEQYEKTPIIGAELRVYYIATVTANKDGSLSYSYTESFEDTGIELDDPELAVKLDGYLTGKSLPSIKIRTNETGTAICENLTLGLYFIRQTSTVEGYAPCTPFLVTIPMVSADGYIYKVNASPKTEVAKLTSITIKKEWNVDKATKVAESVKVQLLKNGNVVKTATLNAKNNWQITYTDMPESDGYSIKEIDVPKDFTDTYSKSGYVFTVTNTATLPETGQLVWPIPVLAVSGMLLIAVGVMLMQKKRNTDD